VNNIMQRMSSALGVAAMGVLINRETAQASADVGARLTPSALPAQFQNLDQAGMVRLHIYVQNHVQAMADGDMFLVAATATGICALLALLLRKPPARAFAPATPPPPTKPVPAGAPLPQRRVPPAVRAARHGSTAPGTRTPRRRDRVGSPNLSKL